MRSIRRFFGITDPCGPTRDSPSAGPQDQRAINAALADDPVRFAEWVTRWALQAFEPHQELGPSDEQCQRLEITAEQREACRREFTVMRTLGACMFVGRNLPVGYYTVFKRELCAATAGILYGIPTEGRVAEISNVIETYIEALGEESPTAFSLSYLDRVYAGNPNEGGMFLAGISQIPMEVATAAFEAIREGYCTLKFGLPFKAVQALHKIAEENRNAV